MSRSSHTLTEIGTEIPVLMYLDSAMYDMQHSIDDYMDLQVHYRTIDSFFLSSPAIIADGISSRPVDGISAVLTSLSKQVSCAIFGQIFLQSVNRNYKFIKI